MSCNSALYGANTNAQTNLTDANINFGNIVRRFGQSISIYGGNVVVKGSGYYSIDTNFDVTATATSTTISLFKDGVAIPGATATITSAVGNNYQISITALVRQTCCCESQITALISAGTITNASVEVTKL